MNGFANPIFCLAVIAAATPAMAAGPIPTASADSGQEVLSVERHSWLPRANFSPPTPITLRRNGNPREYANVLNWYDPCWFDRQLLFEYLWRTDVRYQHDTFERHFRDRPFGFNFEMLGEALDRTAVGSRWQPPFFDIAAFLASLTTAQRKRHTERGYLTLGDLDRDQREMLGGRLGIDFEDQKVRYSIRPR
ncbi:MAG: hypothetical protein SFX74_04470 [Fimbriimonadaceae bacterium]|nr:hypothetical protein [Fimbriimonadaceae bacterium]